MFLKLLAGAVVMFALAGLMLALPSPIDRLAIAPAAIGGAVIFLLPIAATRGWR